MKYRLILFVLIIANFASALAVEYDPGTSYTPIPVPPTTYQSDYVSYDYPAGSSSQLKTFQGTVQEVEKQFNEWSKNMGAKVFVSDKHVLQTPKGGLILLVFYTEAGPAPIPPPSVPRK